LLSPPSALALAWSRLLRNDDLQHVGDIVDSWFAADPVMSRVRVRLLVPAERSGANGRRGHAPDYGRRVQIDVKCVSSLRQQLML